MAGTDDKTISARVEIEGLDDAKAQLQDFGATGDAAMQRLGTSADSASARLQAALTRWTNIADPAAAAQAKLAKGQGIFNDALSAGMITTDRHTQLLDLLTQKYGDVNNATGVASMGMGRLARETRSAFSEFSSGNFSRGLSTLALMGIQLGGLTLGAVGVAAAFGGIPLALAVAADQSENELQRIRDALAATGNAGGVTAGQVLQGADLVATGSGLSISTARESYTTLAASGRIAPELLTPAASLVPGLARATGSSDQDATKLLSQILEDPAKGAQEVSERFNALDAAQLSQIDHLVASGQAQEAQRLVIEALTARLAALGPAEQGFFSSLGTSISNIWTRLGDTVRGPQTTEERLSAARNPALNPYDLESAPGPSDAATVSDLESQQSREQAAAAQAQQEAQQNRLIEQAEAMASGYDSVDTKTQKMTDSAQLLASGLAAAQVQYAALNEAVMTGNTDDPEAANNLARLKAIIDELTHASQGAAAAATHQLDPAQERLRSLTDQAQVLRAAPRDRERMRQTQEIETQYRQNQANPQTAATADQDRQQSYSNLSLQYADKDSDAVGKLNDEAAAQERIAAAYRDSTAAGDQQKVVEEAHAAFLSGAITDEKAYAAALSARTDAERDAKAAETDQNLSQELAQKQLELQLMGQSAGARAQEIADLQTRNELIKEGYEVDTEAFNDELQKRQQINDVIAQTTVAIQQVNDADKAYQQDASELSRVIGTDFDNAITKGKSLHSTIQTLETDIEGVIEKITVTQPLENAITQLLTGKSANTSGSDSSLLAALFSRLGGSSLSGSGLGGLWNALTGNNAVENDADFGAGSDPTQAFSDIADIGADSGWDDLSSLGAMDIFADGGVFDQSGRVSGGKRIRYYATGGVFDTATAFQTASGDAAVIGEAGPEAAVPLVQMAGGRYGVSAAGMGGGPTNHFYIDARNAQPGVEDKIAAVIKMVQGLDSSIERRSISAVVQARNANPTLLNPYNS